ncbi:transmembrane channel-like protein 7 [Chanos chanos]|uniref:Transmembrane channel-like protein n=1 Tax=Chanos chanos TaxID=29144 RepID=A0A6J2V4M9_CHACN|nr:transmembrane channel-like protein 7 [Chanos chanos]
MEDRERKHVNFQRLISEESCSSTLSDESCEYYQTEIFDQLPSSLHHRRQRGGSHGSEGGRFSQPLKALPISLREKRNTREHQNLQRVNIGFWESWRQSQQKGCRRIREQMGMVLSGMLPWRRTFHKIEGKFGVGVKAYFVFLRYLLFLNLLHFIIIAGTVLIPTVLYDKNVSEDYPRTNENDSVLNIFLGSGFVERSPVFYGFYKRGSLALTCLNTPILFLLGIACILILSLFMVVRRTVVGFKHTWLTENRYSSNVSYKVFCGWDFCIQDPQTALLKHSFIRNELKMDLEEQKFQQKVSQRSLGQWVRLVFLRVILNFIVLVLLTGSFCMIYYATEYSQIQLTELHWILSLLRGYLPSITITIANFVLPHIFNKIAAFEDYSLSVQLNLTLIRSIFLKLSSLGIYLFFVYTVRDKQCWENKFGMEMYRLFIFDFLACFFFAFFLVYPRARLVEKNPTSKFARIVGKQKFMIPFNVLDLVYSQTITWVGLFYCPLLPGMSVLKLLFIFYIKKFTVLRCCAPASRMFRTSSSSVLFHFMLLLSLLLSIVTLINNIVQFEPGTCGPFKGDKTVFNVTSACVNSLSDPARNAINYLTSEAFAFTLILAEIIILTSCVSRGQANRHAIERLKDMLVMCSSDKRFLVKQHSTWLRRQRRTQTSVRSPGIREGTYFTQWNETSEPLSVPMGESS